MDRRSMRRKSIRLFYLVLLVAIHAVPARADILWRNTATGQNFVWCMEGVSSVGSAVLTCLNKTRAFVFVSGLFGLA